MMISPQVTSQITPKPSVMVGQTVSYYRILEKLGAGRMGVVYKAYASGEPIFHTRKKSSIGHGNV